MRYANKNPRNRKLQHCKSDPEIYDLIKKLLENYSDKVLNHFIVITKKKIRIIPMEDIK